jgi:VCBS repeat-containing protein
LVLVHLQLPAAIHLYDGEFGTMVLNADGRYIYHNTNIAAVTALGGVAEDVFTYTTVMAASPIRR